jgi:hypothetical protein
VAPGDRLRAHVGVLVGAPRAPVGVGVGAGVDGPGVVVATRPRLRRMTDPLPSAQSTVRCVGMTALWLDHFAPHSV